MNEVTKKKQNTKKERTSSTNKILTKKQINKKKEYICQNQALHIRY